MQGCQRGASASPGAIVRPQATRTVRCRQGRGPKVVGVASLMEIDEPPLAFSASGARPVAVPDVVTTTYVGADRYGFVTAPDGATLRFGVWQPTAQPARGAIVLLTGRAEFIDKYASEVVPQLLARGFAVYGLD